MISNFLNAFYLIQFQFLVRVGGLCYPSNRGRSAIPYVHIRYAFNQAARHTPRWLFVSTLT